MAGCHGDECSRTEFRIKPRSITYTFKKPVGAVEPGAADKKKVQDNLEAKINDEFKPVEKKCADGCECFTTEAGAWKDGPRIKRSMKFTIGEVAGHTCTAEFTQQFKVTRGYCYDPEEEYAMFFDPPIDEVAYDFVFEGDAALIERPEHTFQG